MTDLAGRIVTGPAAARLRIDGRPFINFYGSGYLALSGVAEIREAVRRVLERGAPFAQHVPSAFGATDPDFVPVEQGAASMYGTERSVYFSSGYLIGVVGIASLGQPFDIVLIDESAHYSLVDAATLTGKPIVVFAHCDPDAVRDALKRHPNPRPLLLTDGVFATTGRIPPLAEYARLLAERGGALFVDESHGFGVVGKTGRGAAEWCAVGNVAAVGATFSKAFCAQGAVVPCTETSARHVRGIPCIRGATAGSPLSAAAAAASLAYVHAHPELRATLHANTEYARLRLRGAGLDVLDSPAAIVAFRAGDRPSMQALQQRLFAKEIYVQYSSYIGAGPEGMIRCAIFRDHTREDIDALVDALG